MLRSIIFIISMSLFSNAMPQYLGTLATQFPPHTLDTNRCLTCHASAGPPVLNSFGMDYRSIIVSPNVIKMPQLQTMTIKDKLDFLLQKMDSNKNGISNYKDILTGTIPGN